MFTTAEHWKFFSEFCKYEIASGGPDPQLAMTAEMSRKVSTNELIWRAGCYISVYNVPYAEAIWRNWPIHKAVNEGKDLRDWFEENWNKITTRIERRCVRRPDWMTEFFTGYLRFMDGYHELWEACEDMPPTEAYEVAWEFALQVPRLGRYVALKLLEFLRRYDGLNVKAPDIRPKGGWSPRRTLSDLWETAVVASESDRPEVIALVNKLCEDTLKKLSEEFDIKLDLFQLQVMLCEYRESWQSERQYPGRSIDSELKYALKAEKEWGYKSAIWEARKRLFNPKHLGELNGWNGPREEGPAITLSRYKYTWNDLEYNFSATSPDFSSPVKWGDEKRAKRSFPSCFEKHKDYVGKCPYCHTTLPGVESISRKKVKKLRIYEIIPGKLYQSRRWIDQDPELLKQIMEKYQFTGIALMWSKNDPQLKKLVPWYRWWPMGDGKTIPWDVYRYADEVVAHLQGGGRVLSMCWGGRNRSGLLSAIVAKKYLNCSGVEAFELVKKARKGALVNPYFEEFIKTGGKKPTGMLYL